MIKFGDSTFGLALRWTFKSVMVEFLFPLWTVICTLAAGEESGHAYNVFIAFMAVNMTTMYKIKIQYILIISIELDWSSLWC